MIEIKRSNTADTRTCDYTKVSKEEVLNATYSHVDDVKKGIDFLIDMLVFKANHHDYTKFTNIDEFYSNFQTGFKTQSWYEYHQTIERHHLANPQYIQKDVNLLDVIEHLVDGVMAGLARSGEYRKDLITDETLRKAFDNTVKLLLNEVKVIDNKEDKKMSKHDDMFSSLGFGLTMTELKKKCSVCNSDFKPIEENHYVSRDNRVASNMFGEPKEYDAYDCIVCGCQIIVGERKISKTFKEV